MLSFVFEHVSYKIIGSEHGDVYGVKYDLNMVMYMVLNIYI